MPIEIRELIIKASVSAGGQASQNGGAQHGGADNNDVAPGEEMINTCVEKVLEILKEKNER